MIQDSELFIFYSILVKKDLTYPNSEILSIFKKLKPEISKRPFLACFYEEAYL